MGGGAVSDELGVSGGVGGVAVNLDELSEIANVLEAAAGRLVSAASQVRAARLTVLLSAAPAPQSADAVARTLMLAAWTADAVAGSAGRLAGDVRAARGAYDGVEQRVLRLVRAVAAAPTALYALPEPDDAVRPLALALQLVPPATSSVELTAAETSRGPAPGGVADLLGRVHGLYPDAGGLPGAIGVQRIEAVDGSRSWVVLVPGTQAHAVGGANPFDHASNLQTYAGTAAAAGAAVVAALAAAGARRDEPVLIAGHSLGGMAAMRVAADPAVRERFRVAAVLTAGSPVGRMPSAPGVATLHVEHSRDPVPALDVADPPDEVDRVTVRRSSAPGAHGADLYAETGELVDRSTHPSVVEWRERAGEVLGGPGARAETTVYVATRR